MTYIIAEAGTGHFDPDPEQRYLKAVRLVQAAKDAGADAVKFQAFFDEPLFCFFEGDEKRWERWRQTFLTEDQWHTLHEEADRIGIDLLLSVFSNRGIELLKQTKPRYVKVASRAAKTFPRYELIAELLVSTGMSAKTDVLLNGVNGAESEFTHYMQCVSEYPCPLYKARWSGKYPGLSDHSGTVWPGLDAICRGAAFLEVHFTIPGTGPGPDAPVCLTLEQLKLLTGARDAVATMRGNGGWKQKENTGAS